MRITSDWHIHSQNSCDGACMPVAELVAGARELGITDYGLTDHFHTPYNLPDIAASRTEFLESDPPAGFHFGIEVSVVSQWELDEIAAGRCEDPTYGLRSGGPPGGAIAIGLRAEDIETHGIEYVVGGTHWPMYVPFEREAVVRDYHRQNLLLATCPLVDIVAHPWWWMGHWESAQGMYAAEPWFDDFRAIPRSMHDEFAAAAIANKAVVEINADAMLLNGKYPEHFKRQYLEYLAELRGRGVKLCIGSDCHSAHYRIAFERVARMLESVGLRDEELWRLGPRPAGDAGDGGATA